MRYPIRQGRNIVGVDASGLSQGMIGTQESKIGYHYGNCASTETPFMTNPVEPWKMGFLTPIHSSPFVRSPKNKTKADQQTNSVSLTIGILRTSLVRCDTPRGLERESYANGNCLELEEALTFEFR